MRLPVIVLSIFSVGLLISPTQASSSNIPKELTFTSQDTIIALAFGVAEGLGSIIIEEKLIPDTHWAIKYPASWISMYIAWSFFAMPLILTKEQNEQIKTLSTKALGQLNAFLKSTNDPALQKKLAKSSKRLETFMQPYNRLGNYSSLASWLTYLPLKYYFYMKRKQEEQEKVLALQQNLAQLGQLQQLQSKAA